MRNLWIQTEYAFATWLADVTPVMRDPETLIALLERIAMLGIDQQVFVADVSLADELRLAWDHGHAVDCNLGRGRRISARVAWYDARDQLTEGLVDDLGQLLRTFGPFPISIPDGLMEFGSPPLRISGYRIVYTHAPLTASVSTQYPRTIGFSLYSDIWFPFVDGSAHPWYDGKRLFDNRELASRHTPRLNRFLAETKAAVIEVGGTWATDDDERSDLMAPWIGPHGIRLDGPLPELMAPEALDAPWTA